MLTICIIFGKNFSLFLIFIKIYHDYYLLFNINKEDCKSKIAYCFYGDPYVLILSLNSTGGIQFSWIPLFRSY